MSRSSNQRDASRSYRNAEADGVPLPQASSLLVDLAARVWSDVTEGAGVVHSRMLSAAEEKAAERIYQKGADSAERARLARHARLKREAGAASKALKKGGKR
ncbi:hypothetical protein [Acidovorax sp. SRB_24]|uniref:hypothetical protein n=1 Tax=Acidovorax sp. SRB_24 TaxID=1962700 RepID=UPI00145E20FA|nr:hypothetical protein [Acidovorax sp. SRB_24]NMM77062.1 hypothetical protein [Acidovorax sp. SRB_24]